MVNERLQWARALELDASPMVSRSPESGASMNTPVPSLRPNYTRDDFKAGQTVQLRADGSTGVPRSLHGHLALVLVVPSRTRRILVRLQARGVGHAVGAVANHDLRVTPNQIALILE